MCDGHFGRVTNFFITFVPCAVIQLAKAQFGGATTPPAAATTTTEAAPPSGAVDDGDGEGDNDDDEEQGDNIGGRRRYCRGLRGWRLVICRWRLALRYYRRHVRRG